VLYHHYDAAYRAWVFACRAQCEGMACKAGTHQPSVPPVQSQVNREGEGDSRMFNFVRENPHEQGVDCIRRIDSKGHLCGGY
jgi:hypothetical protein